MVSDKIIDECLKKERGAQKELYEGSSAYVYTIIKSYIREYEARKDLMQEVYIEIFSSLHSYKKELGKFKSWIARIAVHKCINHLKKKKLILVALEEGQNEVEIPSGLYELNKEDLEKILHRMPTGYRIIFLMHAIDGYSHVEIAEMLEIQASSSRSQYSRALKWIQQNLSKLQQIKAYGIS